MDAFGLRDRLIHDYQFYVKSFIKIEDRDISDKVIGKLNSGALWPDPLIQLNPRYRSAETVPHLVESGVLHPECGRVFQDKRQDPPKPMTLYQHQVDAIRKAADGRSYVLTTGTGSGKSLAYIIPIVDYVLRHPEEKGIKAIIVYPLNALANSQQQELEKFINRGYPDGRGPVTFAKYTGQETSAEKEAIRENPPDILLTNYVMLELILTRPFEKPLVNAASGLRFLVLDELHTYRGRQGADVALLVRRAKNYFRAEDIRLIGTSATMSSGSGSRADQRREVAAVASKLFGEHLEAEDVIGETLDRVTHAWDRESEEFRQALSKEVSAGGSLPEQHEDFIASPFAHWLEATFGIEETDDGELVRATPVPIKGKNGAAERLAGLLGIDTDAASKAIEAGLNSSRSNVPTDASGSPPFAFRLHQFISPSETVYATLEPEDDRHIDMSGQRYSPEDADKLLYPLMFCRECGQEFYAVWEDEDRKTGQHAYLPRDRFGIRESEERKRGYLFLDSDRPWPEDEQEVLGRVPDEWLEEKSGRLRVKRSRRKSLPQVRAILPDGHEDSSGTKVAFLPDRFRFCPNCGVAYDFTQRSDYGKLASLGTEGRSTAITILSIFTILQLKQDTELERIARKLLSFTDNRQDASLQSGHFNDFVEIGFLRSSIYSALKSAGSKGITHENLAQEVFDAAGLPFEEYAANPDAMYQARQQAEQALKSVIGYRIYRDLKRGWRVTTPNLEQCGLLLIEYAYLDEVCADEDLWSAAHPALAEADAQTRRRVCKTLLDYMRRELAVDVSYLDQREQDRIRQKSRQHLNPVWGLDPEEKLEYSSILLPRPKQARESQQNIHLSPRGGFGRYLRRRGTLPDWADKPTLDDTKQMIGNVLDALSRAGILRRIESRGRDVPGYQVAASAMLWRRGEGEERLPDPIRVPDQSEEGAKTNAFFKYYYKQMAHNTKSLEAREHTAQIANESRIEREELFREGELPVLYCSPTMELGVDISQLNVVNMRNVPPNPANYAQRSGRAGRGGSPAFVFTYCGKGSPHDQYFFRRQQQIVAGVVTPPQIDVCNEELIKAHLHSIWLKETGQWLGDTLQKIIDFSGEPPSLTLLPSVYSTLDSDKAVDRTRERARRVFSDLLGDLQEAYWFSDDWFDTQLSHCMGEFEQALERWRDLYRSAHNQHKRQAAICRDASRQKRDKDRARRLMMQADQQLNLLTDPQRAYGSDFSSYRYFASEGFLPGYSFPRLPLYAYIPGRRGSDRDEYISRSRFLAVSEFGPRSIIYHDGAKYEIDSVIFSLEDDELGTAMAKICDQCGYMHICADGPGPDLCENCEAELETQIDNLFRMRNVSTHKRERINADEEERRRMGFDVMTAFRFAPRGGKPSYTTATVRSNGEELAELKYGHSARIWRLNLGWRRRKSDTSAGFLLDMERGRWVKDAGDDREPDDPSTAITRRVIPYVEDSKNTLILEPAADMEPEQLKSLLYALENGMTAVFQLEDSELDCDLLPSKEDPARLMYFESTEGGAGVLERLFRESGLMAEVARQALSICHFAPDTGEDLEGPEESDESCARACYSCLLSYHNQPHHLELDRHCIRDLLMKMARSATRSSSTSLPRAEQLERLLRVCDSDLERKWLTILDEMDLALPSRAQHYLECCSTKPDFLYEKQCTAVYIDGPDHDSPQDRQRDREIDECLLNAGYTVLRFRYDEDWEEKLSRYPSVFGKVVN